MPTEKVKADIRYCPRCEQSHAQLEFVVFVDRLVTDDYSEIEWTHWALCPTLQEPILLRIKDYGYDIGKMITK
jgi:hypothetical protein